MPALAGRCECGVAVELVAAEPDAHLACRGLKRCKDCGIAKPLDEFPKRAECRRCHTDRVRRWAAEQYRLNTPYAQRQKEAKREDYQHPVLREKHLASCRRWWASRGRDLRRVRRFEQQGPKSGPTPRAQEGAVQ